jgi:hypothetical protein
MFAGELDSLVILKRSLMVVEISIVKIVVKLIISNTTLRKGYGNP